MPRPRRLSIRLNIILLVSVLVLLSGGLLITLSYRGMGRAVFQMAGQLMEKHREAIVNDLMHRVGKAQSTLDVYRDMEEAGVFQSLSMIDFKLYFTKALENNPEYTNFYFGDEKGTFVMAKRMPDGTLSFRFLFHQGGAIQSSWFHKNPQWKDQFPESETLSEETGYDPRKRPWYQAARAGRKAVWTDVYVFASDGQPGITCSVPTLDKDGKLSGVLGIDMNVASLSQFMNQISVLGAMSVVLNPKGDVVAEAGFPGRRGFAVKEAKDGKELVRPLTLADLGPNPYAPVADAAKADGARAVPLDFAGSSYLAIRSALPPEAPWRWDIVIVVPQDSFMGPARSTLLKTLLLSVLLILASVGVALYFSSHISRPIVALNANMARIRDFDLQEPELAPSFITEVDEMGAAFRQMVGGLRSFQKYVPSSLVKRLLLMGREAAVGGENREMTIFFSDVARFTAMSEKMPPDKLTVLLSAYLSGLTGIILGLERAVDKYIGDSVMAFWGAPEPLENHAQAACRAALRCKSFLAQARSRKEELALPTRMGLHTGRVTVGNIGSEDRLNYTVLGDAVNLASRLEGLNKIYGTSIIISEATLFQAAELVEVRPLDYVVVQGKTEPVHIFELLCLKGALAPQFAAHMDAYRAAYDLYLGRQFAEALRAFTDLNRSAPWDRVAGIYVQRCQAYAAAPPPEDWDRAFRATKK